MVGYMPVPNRPGFDTVPEIWPVPKPVTVGPGKAPPKSRWPYKPRGKEVKLRTRGLVGLIFGVFHGITEMKDALEALFDALPDEIKRATKGRGVDDLARAVWANFDSID